MNMDLIVVTQTLSMLMFAIANYKLSKQVSSLKIENIKWHSQVQYLEDRLKLYDVPENGPVNPWRY